MKIGITGPMTLKLLDFDFKNESNVPKGYDHPMISMLINSMLKRGHKVVAYTTSIGINRSVVYNKGKSLTICIAKRRERNAAKDLFRRERRNLVDLMLSYPVDIINAQWSYEFAWAAINSGMPTIVTLRDYAMKIFCYRSDAYRFIRLIMNYIVLNKSRYLSTNSQYLFNQLSKKQQKKARIISNFYSKNLEKHHLDQEKKSKFILSVSNGFGRLKNISTALEGFSIIRRKFKNIEYHLVGEDMELGGLAYKYAIKNKIEEGVKFFGKLSYEDVIEKMKKALIFLHPSREESFGMTVLEAMAVGTPVVGGHRSGNIPFLLDQGKTGLICDINSPNDVAEKVMKVLSDCDFAKSISLKAKKSVRIKYSEEKTMQEYISYYKKVIKIW